MYEKPDLYNADCMDAMKEFPDKFFDLAIVDPPYGIGCMSMNYTKSGEPRTGKHSFIAALLINGFLAWVLYSAGFWG